VVGISGNPPFSIDYSINSNNQTPLTINGSGNQQYTITLKKFFAATKLSTPLRIKSLAICVDTFNSLANLFVNA